MLNAQNVRIGSRQEELDDPSGDTPRPAISSLSKSPSAVSSLREEPSRGRFRISLRDIVATSVALKSGIDIEVVDGESQQTWPDLLFFGLKRNVSLPPEGISVKPSPARDKEVPEHVAEAISALQRKLILMNNELNCELWLARRNMEHIGRLKKECELAKSAEGERQGLVRFLFQIPVSFPQPRIHQHNKLREYKGEIARLQRELKDHKEQAFSMKSRYAQWNAELQAKVKDFREQKRNWTIDLAALQASDTQHKVRPEARCLMKFPEIFINRDRSKLKENCSGVPTKRSLNLKRRSRRLRIKLTDSGITRGRLNSLSRCRRFGELRLR